MNSETTDCYFENEVFHLCSCCREQSARVVQFLESRQISLRIGDDLAEVRQWIEDLDHGPRLLMVPRCIVDEEKIFQEVLDWARDQFVYIILIRNQKDSLPHVELPFHVWAVYEDSDDGTLLNTLIRVVQVYKREAKYRADYLILQQHTEFQKEYINLKSRELDDNALFMRRLVDFLPVPMFFRNSRNEYVFWNRALEKILGDVVNCFQDNQLETLIGKAFVELWKPENQNRESVSLQVEMRFTDGEMHPILFYVSEFINPWDDGEKGFLGCIIDISDQKKAELERTEQFNLLRAVIDLLPDFIYAKDRDSHFILANKEVAENMGLESPDKLIGHTDHDFFPKEFADIYRADELRVMNTGLPMPQIIEKTHNSRTGKDMWIHTRKVPYYDSTGSIIGIVGSGTDITTIKEMQSRLIQLENIINSSRMIAVLIDYKENHLVKYISEGICRYGYDIDDFATGKLRYVDIIAPSDKPSITVELNAAASQHVCSVKKEYRIQDKEGSLLWVESFVELLYDSHDELSHLQVITFDIEDRKRGEKETELMQVRLRQAEKMESIGQLAAGIAHEINSPIQFIGDNAAFFQEAWDYLSAHLDSSELEDDEDMKYYYNEIPRAIKQSVEGVERVTTIVQAMREFSHPGARQMNFSDLNKSLDQAATVCRNSWKYHCELVKDFDPDLPAVYCDVSKINQCFLNLIVNAAHAVEEKIGPTPQQMGQITLLSRRVDENRVYICVTDTGCGIPRENLERIFEPFFTTKDVGKGTGQGLSLCYDTIVRQHHGEIQVSSEVGKGSEFHIYLRVKPTDEHAKT